MLKSSNLLAFCLCGEVVNGSPQISGCNLCLSTHNQLIQSIMDENILALKITAMIDMLQNLHEININIHFMLRIYTNR